MKKPTPSEPASSRRRRLLFIGDGGQSDELPPLLAEKGISVDFDTQRIPVRKGVTSRHLAYLKIALKAVWVRRQYDKIVIWQQYIGLYYFVLSVLMPLARKPYLVLYIISKKPVGRVGRIKMAIFLRMIASPYNIRTYFMTRVDYLYIRAQRSGLGGKCEVLNDLTMDARYIDDNYTPGLVGAYYFSGGASNRKYEDIAAVAKKLPESRFVMACRGEDISGVMLSANVMVKTDAYQADFDRLILQSRLVIIPIRDLNVMSGQLVCIQAFAAGKPVIMTRNRFLADWIPDAEALPFLRFYDNSDECSQILKSMDDGLIDALGRAAREYYDSSLRLTDFYRRLAEGVSGTAW